MKGQSLRRAMIATATVSLALASCFSPTYNNGDFVCDKTGECPGDLVCVSEGARKICRSPGARPDGSADSARPDGAGTDGPRTDGPRTDGAGTDGSVRDAVEAVLRALGDLVNLPSAQAVANQFCLLIDQNPTNTSLSIFSTLGKKPFASLVRSAYSKSTTLRSFVNASQYWASSGETVAPDAVITQTGNSCETNLGFINAVCFSTGPQYTSGGSYKASDAVNSGGCAEAKK